MVLADLPWGGPLFPPWGIKGVHSFEYDFMEEASMEEASKNSFYVSQREGYAHAYAQSCRIPTECQRHAYALPTCLGLFFNRSNSAFAES